MDFTWLAVALFLPLFPFSALFVIAIRKISNAWLRSAIFLLWPQLGLWLLIKYDVHYTEWLLIWAVTSAVLYALRVLVIRDVGVWLAYIAVSAWSLLWLVVAVKGNDNAMLYGLGFSLPLSVMALLTGELNKRFQSTYAGVISGIAQTHPRLAGVFVVTVLAITATPVFPGFFVLLSSIVMQFSVAPVYAVVMLMVWLLWSWSGMRLLQGVVMGPVSVVSGDRGDVQNLSLVIYSSLMIGITLLGFYTAGGLL